MKNELFTVLILLLVSNLLALAVLLWMPVIRGEKAFFGVRVSRETYLGEGRRILRRYWLCLLAAFFALEAIGFLTAYYRRNFAFALAANFASYFVAFALYANFAREVRPFRVLSEATKFATPLQTRRLADYTHPLLEALVLLLTIAPTVVLIYYYPALPERVPVHWGLNGQPDRWTRKSFSTVFFLPVLMTYLQSWFLLLKYDLVHAKMTLPAEQAEIYLKFKEQLIVSSLRMMDWVRGLLAALLGIVSMLILLTTIEPLRHLLPVANFLIWPCVGLLLFISFYFIYRFMAINNRLEEATGNSNVMRESEAERWTSGGLFYYNPDDPALIVEKRDGLGYTYNFAGKGIKLRLAFLALVPLLVLWALMDL
ncbi:MAG: DUF1648 domain-containing protein [Acidobacteria bacterium]|nr:DUF1648 domain-containing protein [Acidobacteriota bacterium]